MDDALEQQEFIFAEIIEIIPQELKLDFKYKINPLQTIDSKISDLFKEANIDLKYV
jgi:hypothetical protein